MHQNLRAGKGGRGNCFTRSIGWICAIYLAGEGIVIRLAFTGIRVCKPKLRTVNFKVESEKTCHSERAGILTYVHIEQLG